MILYKLTPTLFNYHFLYLDTEDYLADQLFIEQKLTVNFKEEGRNPYYKDYVLIHCSFRKNNENLDKFTTAISKLRNKMLLTGHNDYETIANKIFTELDLKFKEDV